MDIGNPTPISQNAHLVWLCFLFYCICFWRYFLNSVFQHFVLTVTYFKRIPSSLFSSLNFPFFIAHVTSYSCNILYFAAGHNENFQKLALLPEGRTVGTVSPVPRVEKAEGPEGGRRGTCPRHSPSIDHLSLAFPAVHFFPTVRDSCLSIVFTNKAGVGTVADPLPTGTGGAGLYNRCSQLPNGQAGPRVWAGLGRRPACQVVTLSDWREDSVSLGGWPVFWV